MSALLSVSLLLAASGASYASPIIGYGSSDAVAPPKTQELFLMGFEAGLSRSAKPIPKESVVVRRSSGGEKLGAIANAQDLLSQDVALLAGFPTSHEALLAAPIARDRKVLFLVAGASHSRLAESGPSVFTIGDSAKACAQAMIKFLNRKFRGQRGLVISNPYAVFSLDQENALKTSVVNTPSEKLLTFTKLDHDLKLPESEVAKLRAKSVRYIIVTAYADESVNLLDQLSHSDLDVPIITTPAWTTGDLDLLRRLLTKRKAPTYAGSIWDRTSVAYKKFAKLIADRFGRSATAEIAHGFDVGVVVGKTLDGVRGPYTRESVLKAFHSTRCFDGTTAGRLCFSHAGGFAKRSIFFVRFTKQGFVPVR